MKTCFFCGTDECTCIDKIIKRYLYLVNYVQELKLFYIKSNLSKSDTAIWQMMYDQGKEELRKIKLRAIADIEDRIRPKRRTKKLIR